jgi:predicted ribosome quality control (RQC) complex YloA/Tae2 family protein
VLDLRHDGQIHHLLVSWTDRSSRVARIEDTPAAPPHPDDFVMLMRARLENSRLASIHCTDGDRVVTLRFETLDGTWKLVCVLFGQRGLVLQDASDRIAGHSTPMPAWLRGQHATLALPTGAGSAGPAPREGWPTDPADAEAWLGSVYDAVDEDAVAGETRLELGRAIRRALAAAGRRRTALARDLQRVSDAPELQQHADLLQAQRHLLRRGLSEVVVNNWYVDPPTPATIALDPALSPQENIDRLYHRARRYRRGEEKVLERLVQTEALVERLEQALARLDLLDSELALDELRSELERNRWIERPRVAGQKRAQPRTERQPYHAFEAADGTGILVGRGSTDNDRLTFGVARGNDVWMHAADFPGSHVIVRAGGRPVSQVALQDAALLAAWFSRGRLDLVVTVTWTERKHIRKPPGANAGQVSVAGGRGLDVRMDSPRLKSLLEQNREASAVESPGGARARE